MRPSVPRIDGILREFVSQDVPACLSLLAAANDRRALSIEWDSESLTRHCAKEPGRCLVLEAGGMVQGFATWHVLPFQGRTVERVGVIDLIETHQLSGKQQRALLGGVLHRIAADGGALALKLRTGDAPTAAMLASGFIPWFRDSHEALRVIDGSPAVGLNGSQQLLWR
jgi:hypothetical protein